MARHREHVNCQAAGVTKGNFNPANANHLNAWVRDMIAWAQDVRDDVIRLEAAAGLPAGDPGDPPPPE
ncbi:MAG: hypothetical protein HY337_09130 [Gemmatimonadetes bacterium]|nr:hypothetical protein [Gemmatimonadota bacterium]